MKKINNIINNPDDYALIKFRKIDKQIESIKIPKEIEKQITGKNISKMIIEKILDLSIFGKIANFFIQVHDKNNKELKQIKEKLLLAGYLSKTDYHENALKKLYLHINNPWGNAIYNKILRMTENTPPDPKLFEYLSSILTKIIHSEDFEKLFETYNFVLSLIEKLSIQELNILVDYNNYPKFKLKATIMLNQNVSDWYGDFAYKYADKKGITDKNKINRLYHSIRQLGELKLIDAKQTHDKFIRVYWTDFGKEIYEYITFDANSNNKNL